MNKKVLLLAGLLSISGSAFGQVNQWSKSKTKKFNPTELRTSNVKISDFQLLNLDVESLKNQLATAPNRDVDVRSKGVLVKFPSLNGGFDTYEVKEAPTMHSDLQNKYKDIKSYMGVKVGEPSTNIRFAIDPYFGFNASIKSIDGMFYIDSYTKDNSTYIAYNRKDASTNAQFNCLFKDEEQMVKDIENDAANRVVVDGLKRRYRLAISTTIEYTAYTATAAGVGAGTDAQKKAAVLAAVNLAVARLNQVFENDINVVLQLIPNADLLFFVTTDTFDPADAQQMIVENNTVTNNIIGSANYDIGHVFFQSPGGDNGLAYAPSVCSGVKAGGVTGNGAPVGDNFVIDFVAHEMGHQFGAMHTQNNDCNVSAASAYEPGSASTIMGYAGICSPNVQAHSDPYFHSHSIQQMYSYITGTAGNSCAVRTSIANNEPTANAGPDKTIPKETPFALTGVATDPDGDAITYNWEQMDNGIALMPPRPTNAVGPMFRSLVSTTDPTRYFPKLATIVLGYNPNTITPTNQRAWEKLSSVDRPLNFSLLVRDNNPLGGQSKRDFVTLTVTTAAGPFKVTSQSAAGIVWTSGQSQTITWDVANTTAAPVSTANVQILLSTDGGVTFPHVIVASTPNTGTYTFTLPNTYPATTQARLMIKAIDNVFLNVNAANFTINNVLAVDEASANADGIKIYPNPSKGVFTIEAITRQNLKYSVYAMDGKLISDNKEVKSLNGKIVENVVLSDVPSGVYIIQLEKDGQKLSKKLIIKK